MDWKEQRTQISFDRDPWILEVAIFRRISKRDCIFLLFFLTFWMIFFLVVQNALEIRVIYLDSFICNVTVLGRWKFDDHKWKSNWIVASIIIQDQIFWLSILRSLRKVCKVSIGANYSQNLNKNLKFRAMVQSNRSRNWFSKIFSLENVYVHF